jgi:hypothetical protein
MLVKLAVSLFLLAHASIHALFLTPRPQATASGPPWPFELGRSWILAPLGLDPAAARLLGLALTGAVVGGYALAAGATAGLLPTGLQLPGIVIGSVASIGMLAIFFHPWLTLGLVIDVALLWAVLVTNWLPAGEL